MGAWFRRAKSVAAGRGIALRVLVSDALEEKLEKREAAEKPWMSAFGKLKSLHAETQRINAMIDEEFGQIDPLDWQTG